MFKSKNTVFTEIDINLLKKLKIFESVEGIYNNLGYSVTYLRVPGGLIRTVINTEAIDQLFISLNNSWFIVN